MSNIGCAAGLALLALCTSVASAQEYEALPYGDLEYMDSAKDGNEAWWVWARAGRAPVSLLGWSVEKEKPASGEACVKGKPGESLDEEFVIAG